MKLIKYDHIGMLMCIKLSKCQFAVQVYLGFVFIETTTYMWSHKAHMYIANCKQIEKSVLFQLKLFKNCIHSILTNDLQSAGYQMYFNKRFRKVIMSFFYNVFYCLYKQ